MIQRIQSLYLLAALGLLLSTFYITPGIQVNHGTTVALRLFENQNALLTQSGRIALTIVQFISGLTAAILLLSVFSYKRRVRQLKMCIYSIWLLIIDGMGICYALFLGKTAETTSILRLPVLFPFIAAIFVLLAISAIKKDEALVKSYERLR